jgi:hypothetical protein
VWSEAGKSTGLTPRVAVGTPKATAEDNDAGPSLLRQFVARRKATTANEAKLGLALSDGSVVRWQRRWGIS